MSLLLALLIGASVPAEIAHTIAAQHLPPSSVSFTIVDVDSGRVIASDNAGTPRSPASTIKTITTFASLDLLGPAYLWHTKALIRGVLNDDELDGDLILQGGGDPYMTLERWWNFARQIRALGIRRIRGDIVIDNSVFALPPEDLGAFDGRPNRAYNVAPDALMVNFQSIEFRVAPNVARQRIEVRAEPDLGNLTVDNRVRFVPGRCDGGSNRVDFEVTPDRPNHVEFTGVLAGSCEARDITRVLLTPTDYAYGSFVSLWRELGGQIEGRLRVEAAPADARLLLDFESLTLGEIIRLTNKYSSNLMARHLLLTVGEERYGAPATVEKGIAAITEWGKERGVAPQDLELDNGSGLSRTARVSVATMATVLRAAYRSPYAPEFLASLPLAGIDGTLRSRMRTAAAGSVRLKTGHIDGVSGVAGYVSAPDGKVYVLVCLINDPKVDTGAGEPVHAALVQWIQANL
jgi:D-alanyl-D-alanine carboxypeptidase/D-alanyl-D-alanine-endopeptidase (penicillin-binding protein 4)